jgi:hypothetical protein
LIDSLAAPKESSVLDEGHSLVFLNAATFAAFIVLPYHVPNLIKESALLMTAGRGKPWAKSASEDSAEIGRENHFNPMK